MIYKTRVFIYIIYNILMMLNYTFVLEGPGQQRKHNT